MHKYDITRATVFVFRSAAAEQPQLFCLFAFVVIKFNSKWFFSKDDSLEEDKLVILSAVCVFATCIQSHSFGFVCSDI